MAGSSDPSSRRSVLTTLIMVAVAAPLMALSPWLLSAGLIVGCGVYVAYEFALVKIPVRQLQRDVDSGVPGAPVVLRMKQEMNAMLAACQFGITLTSLGLTLALEPAIHDALAKYAVVANYSVGIAMFLGAFLHVTFGELVPKGLALVVPKKVLYATAPLMRLFRLLAVPFIKTCNTIANGVVSTLTGKNPDTDAHHDEAMEIGEALLYAHASGQIRPEQFKLMRNVLGFSERTAREVMTPAKQVMPLDQQASWEENLAIIEEHRYSRYPVIDGEWHNVVGYVRKDDFLWAEMREKRDIQPLILPIDTRPETIQLRQVNLFQGSPIIALFDEYDSFVGILTAEDVMEQIVGEIYDETDEREQPLIEELGDGKFRVDGGTLLGEVANVLEYAELADHEDVDTVSGLFIKVLGRKPRPGDRINMGPFQVTVESAQGFRIRKLRFERSNGTDDPSTVTATGPRRHLSE